MILRNAFTVCRNVLKSTFRRKFNIVSLILLPVLGIIISLVLNNLSPAPINVGICNLDGSVLSQDMAKSISDNKKYKVVTLNEAQVDDYVKAKAVDCALIIPKGFEDKIIKNQFDQISIVSIRGEEVTAWIKNYTNYYVDVLNDMAVAANGNKEVFYKTYKGYKEQELKLVKDELADKKQTKDVTKQSIGFLLVFMLMTSSVAANFILKEKCNRTFFRICCSPVSSGEYVAGNVLANLFMILIQVALVILICTQVLGQDFHIGIGMLFVILMSFGLVSIGFGILIAAFSTSMTQSEHLARILITPTCMLSGCFWPLEYMPKTLQKLADMFPQTWLLKAVNDLQYGKSFKEVASYLLVVIAFAAAFFIIGIFKMKRNENLKSMV